MASKMGYYNVEDYLKQRRQQEKIRVPPKANFLAAVNHIRNMFEGKKFTYGVMGGLEMLCLGYRREMPDLQIAYDDRDFHRIKAKLESDQRYALESTSTRLKLTMVVSVCQKALIHCSPQKY
jgi:hypothetical protein|tara:strand:- start:2646 stop:3011 length:366 start_codon:yes stop_codon:yes gene_type:complete